MRKLLRKLMLIWNIIRGRPVMYRMHVKPDRVYDDNLEKHVNVLRVLNNSRTYLVENFFY